MIILNVYIDSINLTCILSSFYPREFIYIGFISPCVSLLFCIYNSTTWTTFITEYWNGVIAGNSTRGLLHAPLSHQLKFKVI